MPKKQASQLYTYAEIVRNNREIFSKQYPRGWNEADSHYIPKIYLGENIRKRFPSNYMQILYEYSGIPPLSTADNPKSYIPDIFCFYRHHGDKKIYISDVELMGGIHFASKHQYYKNKWRRESITDYFNNYIDKTFHNFPIVFSYISFLTEDFLYNRIDYFMEIFEKYFSNGGTFPPTDSYEEVFF